MGCFVCLFVLYFVLVYDGWCSFRRSLGGLGCLLVFCWLVVCGLVLMCLWCLVSLLFVIVFVCIVFCVVTVGCDLFVWVLML